VRDPGKSSLVRNPGKNAKRRTSLFPSQCSRSDGTDDEEEEDEEEEEEDAAAEFLESPPLSSG